MPIVELSAGPVEYEERQGVGPPLVLLHGVPMTSPTQWAAVLPLLEGCHVVLPTLPMGGHRLPMHLGADLGQLGMARLLGELLAALDLDDVVLVLNDWGGGQFLLTERLPGHERVGALALVACEAFDNFPPPAARPLAVLARVPGGLRLLAQSMRVRAIRRARFGYGGMSLKGIPDDVLRGWFAPAQGSAAITRDLAAFARGVPAREVLLAAASRLASVDLQALVVWARQDTMMPWEHGRRLAEILPRARLVEVDGSSTLVPMDQPEVLAEALLELADGLREP